MTFNKIPEHYLEQICRVLAEPFTGSKITNFLSQAKIDEILPSNYTKWRRLFAAFKHKQENDNCSNAILNYIKLVSHPINFVNSANGEYENFLSQINTVLSFLGLYINNKGQLIKIAKAETLDDARKRANELRNILYNRNIHPDVLKFCKPELVNKNYFHAVFEATKSIADKIRTKSGLTDDGNILIDKAFNIKDPILAINTLRTPAEQNEHKGFKNLLHGIFNMFRNPLAHEAKVNWYIDKNDAIDLLTTLSFIHRKLDKAVKIK